LDLTAVAFPIGWIVTGWAVALPIAALAMRRAPWSRFGESEQVHVWYGAIFCVSVLWNMQATVGEGFRFHLLGIAALTLLAGPALALVGGAVVVGLQIAVRGGLWGNAGLAFVTMVALPAATAWLVLRVAERRLPPNLFVYVFAAAFFGAGLSLGVAGIAGAVALTLGGGRAAELVFGEYVPYLIYLAFGEATVSGMVLTLAVVYRPRWVATFDDARYITGR
jgi:uncharacterized membrane protein